LIEVLKFQKRRERETIYERAVALKGEPKYHDDRYHIASIKWKGKARLDLDYPDGLSLQDKNISEMNNSLEVSRVHCALNGFEN